VPGHVAADLGEVGGGGRPPRRTSRPLKKTSDAVGELEQLVEILADEGAPPRRGCGAAMISA
jgi:hypothetical protein